MPNERLTIILKATQEPCKHTVLIMSPATPILADLNVIITAHRNTTCLAFLFNVIKD